jgi:hypothetical protein
MAIDYDINKVLLVIGLKDASKDAIAKGFPTCEDLKDLFMDMADNKAKVEANFRLVVDTKIVTDIDARRVMFVFDWFVANIVDPNFAWSNFIHAVYVADEWSRAVAKAAKTTTAAPSTSAAHVSSTIDLSTDVLTAYAKRQATPVTPGTVASLKPHLVWNYPFLASSRNSSNIHQLHNTNIVLASPFPLDVLEVYRKLVAAAKPAIIDLVPTSAFDWYHALWPHNRCADIIFEMNDALALRLDQTGTMNLDDETIHNLYQKQILKTSSGVQSYAFIHALLKRKNANSMTKFQPRRTLRKQHPLDPLLPIWNATISSCIPWVFPSMTKLSLAFSPLPEELTLVEIILWIKDIHSFHNSSTAIINHYVHPTNDKELSNTHHNRQYSSSDSHPTHPSSSDSRPARDVRTHSETQCMCWRWGHSVEKCQQMAMRFLIVNYLKKYANIESAGKILERWRLTNNQYSRSARSTVRAIRATMSENMAVHTYDEIMEKFYTEDDALSDFI